MALPPVLQELIEKAAKDIAERAVKTLVPQVVDKAVQVVADQREEECVAIIKFLQREVRDLRNRERHLFLMRSPQWCAALLEAIIARIKQGDHLLEQDDNLKGTP